MKLDCGNCVVRDWKRSDKPALLRIADNRRVWRNLTHAFPHPYTETDAEQWFCTLEGMPEPTHWAIEVDGQAAGGIGVTLGQGVFRKSAELGYWLGEPYWGRGIATAAVKQVSRYCMSRYRLVRLHCAVFEWNHASMRVLEKCGFSREGIARASVIKEGRIIDSLNYALVAQSVLSVDASP